MAQVQYLVMYRYIHPISNKPVTNKQKGYKTFGIDTISSSGSAKTDLLPEVNFKVTDLKLNPQTSLTYTAEEYAAARNYTTDPVFDMLFVLTGVQVAAKAIAGSGTTHKVAIDRFVQVNGDPWFVASITGSLEAAMATAKRLVMKIGIGNVKVVKQVPLEIQLEIE